MHWFYCDARVRKEPDSYTSCQHIRAVPPEIAHVYGNICAEAETFHTWSSQYSNITDTKTLRTFPRYDVFFGTSKYSVFD